MFTPLSQPHRFPPRAADDRGPRLATAQILYYLPDHPNLLQSFVWQTQDVAPSYPRSARFLDHWRREVQAVIHSVEVSARTLHDGPSHRRADFEGGLH